MSEMGGYAEAMAMSAGVLSRPADEFENDEMIEQMWAAKAYQYAEIHFNILCSADPSLLRLTPNGDEIYELFRQEFPDFYVPVVDEDEMKSPKGKESDLIKLLMYWATRLKDCAKADAKGDPKKWRAFCEKFKEKVEDYSFGTLLRKDCTDEYSPENSILVPRIQFYAIELARNREGHNSVIQSKYRKKKLQDS